ncbi:MAG: helix-hairpin-helix domain-containing protein, partial [Methanimicrococcus sp.]|nr:helix-hairpin-helix domain-containing protein [Methanimicrococcus sp.]
KPLLAYLKKMEEEAGTSGASKAAKRIAADLYFRQAFHLTEKCEAEHPKFSAVQHIVSNQLVASPDSKIIVFTNFRETANVVREALGEVPDVRPVRFVGQGSRNKDKGLTQKQQTEIIEQFRAGVHNVLIATSVAEEGLDIPATDLVLFYEPVPSEIRSIQRKGRTGRFQAGRVIVLVTKGTRDEAYRWSSQNKEKRMLFEMENLKKTFLNETVDNVSGGQKVFADFEREFKEKYASARPETLPAEKETAPNVPEILAGCEEPMDVSAADFPALNMPPVRSHVFSDNFETDDLVFDDPKEPVLRILADSREMKSGILRRLEAQGLLLKTAKLDVADYVISDDMAVERKTAADFTASLIDGKRNLFSQLIDLSRAYKKPVLIVEGMDETAGGSMNQNSIRGALLSIEIDLNVSIFYTKDEDETALLLKMMAKKEQIAGKKTVNPHGKKPAKTTGEQQEYVLSSISGIGPHAARLLLNEFGSLNNIFNASEEDLCRMKGIGKKTARRIREVVEAEYKK